MILRPMRTKTISLETFSQKITQVRIYHPSYDTILTLHSHIDSELEDSKGFGKIGFGSGFGLGVGAPYGGAFNTVPDRVGSAPATDLSVVLYL